MKYRLKRCFLFIGNIIFLLLFTWLGHILIIENFVGKVLTDKSNLFSLILVYNDGAAFNILSGCNYLLIIIATIIVLLCIGFTIFHKFYIKPSFLFLMATFCAGILGNAIERYLYGYVTDYIKINIFNFPVFNLYDILITLSALLIALIIIHDTKKRNQDIKDEEEDDLYDQYL